MAASENGWQPAKVGQDQLTWFTVPGTGVNLQTMSGWPMLVMRAFAADYNAYVEPLRDADSASWTPTNSVATSNHLNGTAMDLNWNSHPFQVKGTFNSSQMKTIRDLLDFYEGMIFWAGDWNSPIDEMHWQLGYDTYNNPDMGSFIQRKIRSDGYSTFRRGPTEAMPMLDPVDILAQAAGLSYARAEAILPQVSQGLSSSDCTTVKRIAMWLAQIGHESDSFNATEEYASGDESTDRWKYKGRTWIQITWQVNYAGFSQWAYERDLVSSPDYFVRNSTALADQKWAGYGPAWYWTVARPGINAMCDNGDLVGVTKAINGGTNGLPDRQTRYARALVQGDKLLALLPAPTAPPEEGFLMALSDAEQREVLDLLRQQSGYRRVSRSPLRHVGEKETETIAGFAWNTDGSVHVLLIELLARLGDPDALNLLREVANLDPARYPERAHDRNLAQAILNSLAGVKTVESAAPTGLTPGLAPAPVIVTAPVVQTTAVLPPERPVDAPEPIPVVVTPPSEGGGVQSQIDALNSELSALRGVLSGLSQQMKG